MPPYLALFLWLVLLVALFRFDPAKVPGTSPALWIPVIWVFITATRLPSQWLEGRVDIGGSIEEGNPLDRIVFTALMFLALVILTRRQFNWVNFFSSNVAWSLLLSFALLSCLWSDFPLVAVKRWVRDMGSYFVILVVLSDTRPLEAFRTLLRRVCYLIIPLSILLIKYFPDVGKQYDSWTGANMFAGATTGKNLLGAACLISAMFFFWDTSTRWQERKDRRTKRIIQVNFAFLAMTLWLLRLSSSATSTVCLTVGCLVMVAMQGKFAKYHGTFLKALLPVSFCLYLLLAFGLDLSGLMASAVGRDPTLTDRTLIWKTLLTMHTNPIIGTGYESFWLGPRLVHIWRVLGGINEAHNGYLEVYLNLGLIGAALLILFLLASYRGVCRGLPSSLGLSSFSLAIWTVMLFYNMTESAFKVHPMWIVLLLVTLTVPQRVENQLGDTGLSRRSIGRLRAQATETPDHKERDVPARRYERPLRPGRERAETPMREERTRRLRDAKGSVVSE